MREVRGRLWGSVGERCERVCWGMGEVKGDVGKCERRHGKSQQTSFNTSPHISPTPQHTFPHLSQHFPISPPHPNTLSHTFPNSQHFVTSPHLSSPYPHLNTLSHTPKHFSTPPPTDFLTPLSTLLLQTSWQP